jgi:hypothetical protein
MADGKDGIIFIVSDSASAGGSAQNNQGVWFSLGHVVDGL